MSLAAQRYLKKIDPSPVLPPYYKVLHADKSSHDLFLTPTKSEFDPNESSLSLAYDNKNNTKIQDQSLWDNKSIYDIPNSSEFKSFQYEQPMYSKHNQSIGESAYGSLSPNNHNITEVSYMNLQKKDNLPEDTGLLFGSPEVKKRKTVHSFLEETVVDELKNDTMNTEVLFGNDTLSTVCMVNMKKKILVESQSILNQMQSKDEVNNDELLLSSFKSSINNSLNSKKSYKMSNHRSEFANLQPLSQKPKNSLKADFRKKNKIDKSIFNKSIQCIDETIVSQNNNLDAIEKSVMFDEKLNLNSSYKAQKIFNLDSHIIKDFYKVMSSQNWNFTIENLPEMVEPSLEYLEYKLEPREKIRFGMAKEDAKIVFGDCVEIEQSSQELEESFTKPDGLVSSTPKKSGSFSQNELFEILRESPEIKEVINEESNKIETTSGKSVLLKTSELEAQDSFDINSNKNKEHLTLARYVDMAKEKDLNSPNIEKQRQENDDLQLISQLSRHLGPEVVHPE